MDNIIYYIDSILYIYKDLYKITISGEFIAMILSQEKINKNVEKNLLNPMTLTFKFQRKITRDGSKNIFASTSTKKILRRRRTDFFASLRQPRKIG